MCANTQAFFSVCIPQRAYPAQASSATSGLKLLKVVAFSTTFFSPKLQANISSQLSTRYFHCTHPGCCLPSGRFKKSSSFPVCSAQLVLSSLTFLSSHPDLPNASLSGLSPYPQIQAPSCAWIYFRMSLPLVSPSGFHLSPLLPAPVTSQPWSPMSVSSPHPSALSVPLRLPQTLWQLVPCLSILSASSCPTPFRLDRVLCLS